jgi:patatin-related protein
MGWNGGVSLAVWMGGVAVELDQARRVQRPVSVAKAKNKRPPIEGPARTTEDLYRALLTAFNRVLVIDILAGASAGGLNGALLAGAMMHDRPLTADFLRRRWLSIGDFGTLLQPLSNKNPASVMQGVRFFEQLRAAFVDLLGGDTPPADAGCDGNQPVFLDIQVTDVLGKQHCFTDAWDKGFFASEFRAPVKFRRFEDFTAPNLAAAARASASFPAAFEPQALTGKAAALMGFPGKTRWAIDGGLLENAPIKPAIELIPRVASALPGRRYVCYVNAAPTAYEPEDDTPPGQPSLARVLSYAINLPRDGRVIDQLFALDDATRRAGATAGAGVRLLSRASDVLREIARSLLSSYQSRRALLSLTELLGSGLSNGQPTGGPGRAHQALERLQALRDKDGTSDGQPASSLPWIPSNVDPPASPEEWRWGVRAAQRVLQLELDALRAGLLAIRRDDQFDVEPIIEALQAIAGDLHALEAVYDDFIDPDGASAQAAERLLCENLEECRRALTELVNLARGIGMIVFSYLRPATDAFYTAYSNLPERARTEAGLPATSELFGSPGSDDSKEGDRRLATFLQRALAIETIRRTFSDDFDIESVQRLNVAQLTPLIEAPLFDRPPTSNPGGNPGGGGDDPDSKDPPQQLGPVSAKDKLAGIRLNHFAGFYRSSWRENDFMWGRLDGAAGIARLLVDPERARALDLLESGSAPESWAQLATALVPDGESVGDDERLRLVVELLEREKEAPKLGPDPTPDQVREALSSALRHDLIEKRGNDLSDRPGVFTWAVCTRALQYEILREEAPLLLEQLSADKEAGAYRTKLDWDTSSGFWPMIRDLREGGKGKAYESLPKRLGCDDPDEGASTLALRTLSQTMLVALAALTGPVPLARFLQPVRLPLLAIAGSTARRALDRIAVTLGFAGAAWYLSARWLTEPVPPGKNAPHKAQVVPLETLWSPQFIVLWLAIFAVVGVAAVPALRAIRTHSKGRMVWEGAVAVTFLACAGAVALIWQWDLRGTIEALTTRHARYSPPDGILWAAAAAAGVSAASSLETVLRLAGPFLKRLGKWVSLSSLIFGGIGAVLAYYCARHGLYAGLRAGGFKRFCAVLAFAGPAAVAGYVSVGPPIVKAFQRLRRFMGRMRTETIPRAAKSAKQWLRGKLRWPWRRR